MCKTHVYYIFFVFILKKVCDTMSQVEEIIQLGRNERINDIFESMELERLTTTETDIIEEVDSLIEMVNVVDMGNDTYLVMCRYVMR
jgi:hypothetical protein